MAQGISEAQLLGVTEADPSYDIDGWDAAAKTAALANVLMDARVTPRHVERKGLGEFTTAEAVDLAKSGQTMLLVSRGERSGNTVRLTVRPDRPPTPGRSA